MSLATLYTGFASSQLMRSAEILFRNNLRMENLRKCLDSTEASLTAYLTAKSSEALKDYIMYSNQLYESSQNLNRDIKLDESLLLQRDLAYLVDSYLEDSGASVSAKRGRDVSAYTESYQSSERGAELVRFLITRIEGIFLSDSLEAFSTFEAQMKRVILTNFLLVLAASLMSFMILVRYSYTLTDPLRRLAEAARAVGRGEYDHELPPPDSQDEIGTMAEAFSSMQDSVRLAFEELKSKAQIEKSLMEEKVHVLDIEHKLKDAELLALQTQINPHFLFNTLSAGMQLALVEEADNTADFLDKLAGFIRYTLKSPARSVLVSDEIACAERYIWLLKLRFGDRYRFEVEAEDAILPVETPALLLQPLVENAVVHGLKDSIEGAVRISARIESLVPAGATVAEGASGAESLSQAESSSRASGSAEPFAVLCVEDSGEGMSAEAIAQILGEDGVLSDLASDAYPAVPEAGIGLRNVIRRVKLATGGRGWVAIESQKGRGTSVKIILPLKGNS
jgi:two-component system, sensor histidine kinase YesM